MTASRFVGSKASGILLLAALLVSWQIAALSTGSPNLPALSTIVLDFIAGIRSGELPEAFGSSLWIMFIGYGVGSIVAIMVGLLMATVRVVNALLEPMVELLRPIPIPAIVPPLILLLGVDEALKIFVVAFSVFFPVLINTIAGVRAVDRIAIDVARTMRSGSLRTARFVILPASLPYILAGMRISLPLALIITVTAEMIAGSAGIGYYLLTMQYAMRPSEMYAAILLLAIVGYSLNRMFVIIESRMLHWYHANVAI